MELRVRPLTAADWPRVRAVYEQGIATGDATFETAAPGWEQWDAAHLAVRLVAERDGRVVGWCALSPTSTRPVYAGVVEESVYVDPAAHGTGVGRTLLTAVLRAAAEAGAWTVQTGIFPENAASLALHEQVGFRRVGVRERIGRDPRTGRWRDVVLLEHRAWS